MVAVTVTVVPGRVTVWVAVVRSVAVAVTVSVIVDAVSLTICVAVATTVSVTVGGVSLTVFVAVTVTVAVETVTDGLELAVQKVGVTETVRVLAEHVDVAGAGPVVVVVGFDVDVWQWERRQEQTELISALPADPRIPARGGGAFLPLAEHEDFRTRSQKVVTADWNCGGMSNPFSKELQVMRLASEQASDDP